MKKIYINILVATIMATSLSTTAWAQLKVARLSSYNNTIGLERVNENTSSIMLSRYFYAGYNTICLPFDVTTDNLRTLFGEDVAIEKFTKAEGNILSFVDVTNEGIKAGVPYLIYAPTTKSVTFATNNLNIVSSPIAITNGSYTMSGYFNKTTPTNLYGIPAKQDTDILQAILVSTNGEKSILPTRCGISGSNGAAAPIIKHVTSLTETTAINTLIANDAIVDVYNTHGVLVKKNIRMSEAMNTLSHGIYVVEGQKFVIK